MMRFEETELRLGLPGNGAGGGLSEQGLEVARKRGFSETERHAGVELKLNLSSSNEEDGVDLNEEEANSNSLFKEKTLPVAHQAKPPAAKAQVVGWPPVRSFRKNVLAVQKSNTKESEEHAKLNGNNNAASFVKVSMDGAPYLRKVDLKMYKSYKELSDALSQMLTSFSMGSQGIMKDFMNESMPIDILNSSDYVPTYEDKDGDWMLVGDVPWQMFVESCKRLLIMKGKEAIGLAPRAMQKRNRS